MAVLALLVVSTRLAHAFATSGVPGMRTDPETEADSLPIVGEFATPGDRGLTRHMPNYEGYSWNLRRIGADKREQTGAGVNIYLLDVGVRHTHREFGGRSIPTLSIAKGKLEACDPKDYQCASDEGPKVHGKTRGGTYMGSLAVGATRGVAPGATLRVLKVETDALLADIFASLEWVATNAVRPAVLSQGSYASSESAGWQQAVDDVVAAGVVYIAGAGSDKGGSDQCQDMVRPGRVPSAIAVGAAFPNNERYHDSHFGSCVDLWAPGALIIGASHLCDDGLRSSEPGDDKSDEAAQQVAGAAALLLEADPQKNSSEVLEALRETAAVGAVTNLGTNDNNFLLWVGSGDAPTVPSAPTPAPSPPAPCPENSTLEDDECVCEISAGFLCYEGGHFGCRDKRSQQVGRFDPQRSSRSCTDCVCQGYVRPEPLKNSCPKSSFAEVDGVSCECGSGVSDSYCYQGGQLGCLFTGGWSDVKFWRNCTDCECRAVCASAEEKPTPEPDAGSFWFIVFMVIGSVLFALCVYYVVCVVGVGRGEQRQNPASYELKGDADAS